MMAMLRRTPSEFLDRLEQRVTVVSASAWGVQLAAGFSRARVMSIYARLLSRFGAVLKGRDPSILTSLSRSRGTRTFYQVRLGADTRKAADALCGEIRRAGGSCIVLRNRPSRA
jgi:hypothetical protein